MEYRWRRSPTQDFRVGHVHFMLFMSIGAPNANSFFGGIWALTFHHFENVPMGAPTILSSTVSLNDVIIHHLNLEGVLGIL